MCMRACHTHSGILSGDILWCTFSATPQIKDLRSFELLKSNLTNCGTRFSKVINVSLCFCPVDLRDLRMKIYFLIYAGLRWPNTVFARAFADAIQRAHKD